MNLDTLQRLSLILTIAGQIIDLLRKIRLGKPTRKA